MLAPSDRDLLERDPAAYASQRVGEILDPFDGVGLVPLQQDFLGLASRVERTLRPGGAVRLDPGSGTLQAEADGLSWVLIGGQLRGSPFDADIGARISAALRQADAVASQETGRLLAAGGALRGRGPPTGDP